MRSPSENLIAVATAQGNAVKDFFRVKNRSLQERRKKARLLPITAGGHAPPAQRSLAYAHTARRHRTRGHRCVRSAWPGSSMSGFSTTWSFMAIPNGSPSIWLFWPSSGSGPTSPHSPPPSHKPNAGPPLSSHAWPSTAIQGLTGALVTWTSQLLPLALATLPALPGTMRTESHWRVGRWLARLAVDGSRISSATHTRSTSKPFLRARATATARTAKYRREEAERASSQACRRGRSSRRSGRPCCGTWACVCRGSWKNGPSYSNEPRPLPATARRAAIPGRHAVLCRCGLRRLRLCGKPSRTPGTAF